MSDPIDELFQDFDRGSMSRRQLFQVLGIAAVGVAVPAQVFSQGRCGGARANDPGCDKTPAKAPFDPTGWKTVSLDHFTMQAADYKKEVAYYATLMNWKIRSDDGKQAVMDIGDWASALVQGGYQPPPPPPAPAPTPGDSAGRGGGRGGGAGRAPRNVVWDSCCWGIDQWDKNKVEAELKKRGLNPVYEMSAGVETFRIQDPGGFTIRIADGRKNRRSGSSSAPLPAPAPFEGTDWHSVWLDHISFQCPDYKASTAFYEALLGWKSRGDEGSQATCEIGDIGGIIIRGGAGPTGGRGGGAPAPTRRVASMDHISFGIAPWDPDKVKAELEKRGLSPRPDTGGRAEMHESKFQSYHTTTPNGFDLQISNVTRATRTL